MSEYKYTVKTTCKFCGKTFQSFALNKVCNECDNDMERQFKIIKAYLQEFPKATVAEVCKELDIPTALVKYYLREERLEILSNSGNYFLKCNMCNKPISKGRYCFECEIKAIRSEMKTMLAKDDEISTEHEVAKFHLRKYLNTKNSRK